MEKNMKKYVCRYTQEYTYIYIYKLNHFAVYHKLEQHCKLYFNYKKNRQIFPCLQLAKCVFGQLP